MNTPAVLIDQRIVDNNINRYQHYCNTHGLKLRPHIKTHKLPQFAKQQIAAGATGITCQKISEAEVMADNGIDDILISYNILGKAKLQRLKQLASRVKKLCVVADNPHVITGLAQTFTKHSPIQCMVECDTGAGRCGVQTPDQAVALAEQIALEPALVFRGLMTYPAVAGYPQVQQFMAEAKTKLNARGINCPEISSGGSPDMWQAHQAPIITEYRIGTYIYNDRSLITHNTCQQTDCALQVISTVISTPTPTRAIIDAGSKVLTSDLNGLQGYGLIVDHPHWTIQALYEEHAIINSAKDMKLIPGQQLAIIPNHCCVVSNMVNQVLLTYGKTLTETTVAARGCVQ